jgi:putative transposase
LLLPFFVRISISSRAENGEQVKTFYRWRKEYGGLQLEQAKKFKELQKGNAQLKRALATLTLEKQVLKDIAEGNF